ncbi:sulfatase-like hydrolase/transferase [Alienimonas californiensis]|uniref:Arylsulfatase n=1 Tax=Alienimonas californiensis TaxID=2527989 RepID=A0A517P7X1_9PLAN|nr:sulfatase-like hydrolase/transferase [Alienimonas californiensis]QDT15462.1 Arylsulfatase [Alienimonas californiensis]
MIAVPALLAAAVLAPGAPDEAPPTDRRPNVVVVFIDDLGWADFSCFHDRADVRPAIAARPTEARTPNVDRLAAEGLRFGRFYVNSPICSPSRTALTTGQYPQRWSIGSYLAHRQLNADRGVANWLDPAAPTLPRLLQAAGYRTGHFGKWHMGGQRDVAEAPLIPEYGFDESLTNFEGLGPRVLPLLDAYDGSKPKPHALGSDTLGRGPIRWENRDDVTAAFVADALTFVDEAQAAGEPFYLNLWPDDVHTPLFPPAARRGDGSKGELYRGVLKTMDAQLGLLFDRIRHDDALRENTLILVCSDNGPERGAGSAGPLRGLKAMLYEGGVRSPLVVWGPGLVEPAAVNSFNGDSLFSACDLVPSLLTICGVELEDGPGFDGENLADVLLGRANRSRTEPLFFRRPPDRDRYFGVDDLPDLAVLDGAAGSSDGSSPVGPRWKLLCEYDGSQAQLYDLAADPGETTDLAAAHPAVRARLRDAVVAWHESLPPDHGETFGD